MEKQISMKNNARERESREKNGCYILFEIAIYGKYFFCKRINSVVNRTVFP